MASADILRAARARIEDPKNWTQGEYARDSTGAVVSPHSGSAVCWCSYGALLAEGVDESSDEAVVLRKSSRDLFGFSVLYVNDRRTHEDVVRAFDAAIAAAEAEAGR